MKRLLLSSASLLWFVSGFATAASVDVLVRGMDGSAVEDAAIVLQPQGGSRATGRKRTASIAQFDREFHPYLTIIEKGTAVEFPNRDPFKHHVYSFSPPNVFEIKLYADKPVRPITFDKAGEVVLGCNIHDWMQAHVLVVDTPWFARTGADGRASIKALPGGAYRLRLWHPRQKRSVAEMPLELAASASQRFDLVIEVEPRQLIQKPPLDAGSY